MTYEGRGTEGGGKGKFAATIEENSKQNWTVVVIVGYTCGDFPLYLINIYFAEHYYK